MAMNGRAMNMLVDPVNHPEPEDEPEYVEPEVGEENPMHATPIVTVHGQRHTNFHRHGATNVVFENDYIGHRERVFIDLP